MEENTQQTEQVVVDIECCVNCSQHRWCTRHDETKYEKAVEEVRAAVLAECPNVIVRKNAQTNAPRLGALEVSIGDSVIFSKLKSGLWPAPKLLAANVKAFIEAEKRQDKNSAKSFVVKGADVNKKQRKVTEMRARSPPVGTLRSLGAVPRDEVMSKTSAGFRPSPPNLVTPEHLAGGDPKRRSASHDPMDRVQSKKELEEELPKVDEAPTDRKESPREKAAEHHEESPHREHHGAENHAKPEEHAPHGEHPANENPPPKGEHQGHHEPQGEAHPANEKPAQGVQAEEPLKA
eukprot:TRINITY_DN19529_c0_g1_i2.p1 TRINITY_DN19529_c0_g1~~TRINITY_DN19529_c0_g1_i2.p1  ORF type:complete len:292 (+),score=66.95 TRINITY_DN19529_c0_g1_i2:127-1002(+)